MGMNLGIDGINVIPTTFLTSFPIQIPKEVIYKHKT